VVRLLHTQEDKGKLDEEEYFLARPKKLLSQRLKAYARRRNFKATPVWPHVFIDETRIFCLAESRYPPSKEFNSNVVGFGEDLRLFDGQKYLLVKSFNKKWSFDKKYIKEIVEAFRNLGSDFVGYSMLPEKPTLIIWGVGVWAALAPRINEEDFENERTAFIRRMKEECGFFDLKEEGGLVVVGEGKNMNFNWSQLDENRFVELCYDIMSSHPRVKNVKITEGSSDLGQDIRAVETVETLLGQEKKTWTIQCKHLTSRKVSTSDIRNILNAYSQLKFDVFCLMASNFVSPGCQRLLKSWEILPNVNIKTDFWDRKRIEDYLLKKTEIYIRYFTKTHSH